jgi:polysaccharide export outer membrane protein
MSLHRPGRALALAFCLLVPLIAPRPSQAQLPQQGAAGGGAMLSREDLTKLLQQYEAALHSPAYSGSVKAAFKAAAERVRDRLENGDFHPGDRVALTVEGQPNLPDTVPVEAGPKITLPVFGDISLKGVLRSEIAAHLTKALGRMIRDPVVHAQALMRISVQGAVARPGFYVVPTDILVSDVLMTAGGPSQTADLSKLKIERGTEQIYGGKELQTDMRAGRTLDQLSLQAGDQIVLPQKSSSNWWGPVLRYGLIVATTLVLGVRIAGF